MSIIEEIFLFPNREILYPFFEFFGARIYTFGIALTLCFFAFLWNLQRLEKRFWYSFTFFSHNILWYFLSVFFFSRFFYVIGRWNDMKFIKDPFEFFIMSEYNFSLFGAIFWFLVVLVTLCRIEKTPVSRYIDGTVLAFLAALCIGYVGSIFGWQVYGRETVLWIEIIYTNENASVPFQVPIFPLPIIYSIVSFILFSGMYILSLFIHVKGFIGYLGLLIFSSMILIFEFFSGKQDIISVISVFNLPQIFALVLAGASGYQLYKIFKKDMYSAEKHIPL